MSKNEQDTEGEKLDELARRIAERMRSPQGIDALARAAEATRARSAETADAARLDPRVLHKRVTF